MLERSKLKEQQAAYAKSTTKESNFALCTGVVAGAQRSKFAPFFSAQLADQSGRGKRVAALQEGLEVLDDLTEKAKQLSEERELRRLIDEELALLERK